MSNKDAAIRQEAVRALGNAGDAAGLAARVLGKVGAQAVDPIIEVLEVGREHTRRLAAEVLGQTGKPGAVHALVGVFQDDEEGVCTAAADVREFTSNRPCGAEWVCGYP